MDSQNTQHKIALAIGIAAVGTMIFALYKKYSKKEEKNEKNEKKDVMEENEIKAIQLKEEGNKFFKEEKFDEAVTCYTEALKLTTKDSHFYYSNRSAAYLSKNDYDSALKDAQKCIEINPKWSKGYFRFGKVLYELNQYEEAFKKFYYGFTLDPKNEELKNLMEITKKSLKSFGDFDFKSILDMKISSLYFHNINEEICNSKLNIEYNKVKEFIQLEIKNKTIDSTDFFEKEPLNQCFKNFPLETFLVVLQTLIELEQNETAYKYSLKALEQFPDNADILLLVTISTLKSKTNNTDFNHLLALIRKAYKIKPDDILISHTLALIIVQLILLIPQKDFDFIRELLDDLKKALKNPKVNHILIADAGVRLWFKLFEDPNISSKFQEESRQLLNDENNLYIKSLYDGAFSQLIMVPFFIESLSLVVFNNPGIESVLAPFRGAFLTIFSEPNEIFEKISPFLFSLAIQCFKTNYAWYTSDIEKKKLDTLISKVKASIKQNPELLINNTTLDKKFMFQLAIISLYRPLSNINGLYDLISQIDLSTFHPLFQIILKKHILDYKEELKILQNMEVLTDNVLSSQTLNYYTSNPFINIWDSAGLVGGRLKKITFKQELEWLVGDRYKPIGFDGVTNVLIAGCGSGAEVYQMNYVYENLNITAIDFCNRSLAYAIRQNTELGVTNAKFYYADILQLEPSLFSKPFDLIVANGVIHFLSDPLEGWKRLASLLRPGGILRMNLYSSKFINLIGKTRQYLSKKLPTSMFDNSSPLPKVVRMPTEDEIRLARKYLISISEGESDSADIEEICMLPGFYTLNEFKDLIFHPHVFAFTFKTIVDCISKCGLKLVSFEFPQVPQDIILKYRVEFPDDPNLLNGQYLDTFEKKYPDSFYNIFMTNSFICEKPI